MRLGHVVLLLYGLLMLAGGIMGYVKGGSRASLVWGVVSAVVLAVGWFVARTNPQAGFAIGGIWAGVLCAVFLMRYLRTGKVMPAAALMVVSVLALLLLVYSAIRYGRS